MSLKVGLIGCGNISDVYLLNAPRFRDIAVTAVADINEEAARRQAERYSLPSRTVKDLLASENVDIVLNLTIPAAHAEVSLAALAAGKHIYSEKPLATKLADGRAIVAAAEAKELRVGVAPDTVLGASFQEARAMIDANTIGKVLTGLAAFLSHGMEHWHPNPDFFFRAGAGPVFDMGPYYLTALVALLGPVASVQALGQIGFPERTVTAPDSPMRDRIFDVETMTSVQALLDFTSGEQVTLLMSWDVWRHGVLPLELHGETGSLRLPDPNWFGGELHIARGRFDWSAIETQSLTFGRANWPADKPEHANYRGLGLADMARGIEDKRPHRANGEIGLHVLAIMEGILDAATERRRVLIEPSCERPAPLLEDEAAGLLKEGREWRRFGTPAASGSPPA
jgi:predicted dehydrogenase